MKTTVPTISMDPKARYVTQSSAYDRLATGRVLTDRRIAQLQAQGRYGPVPPKPRTAAKRHRLTAAEILSRYAI